MTKEAHVMVRSLARFSSLSFTLVLAVLFYGCGGEEGTTDPPPEDPRATRAVVASGNSQSGTVGQALSAPLVVQIDDQNGDPMSGVNVSFTVAAGRGTVSPTSGVTDAAGQASTIWTLGTAAGAGQRVTAAVVGSASISTSFTATAAADDAYVVSVVSGDNQFAFTGTNVPADIVVKVRDQYANNVSGQIVTYAIPTGRGRLDSSVVFTDSNGEARTGWTVGSTTGIDTATASVANLPADRGLATFTATVHNVSVSSTNPSTLTLGSNATIVGTGFDPVAANNAVTVGDIVATVNSATTTELDITVPYACRPVGPVDVVVNVSGIPSAPLSTTLTPTSFLDMEIGDQQIVRNPAEYCLQFDEEVAAESYLIGVQSTSEAVSTVTPIVFSSVAAAGSASPPALLARPETNTSNRTRPITSPARMERLARHRAVEARIREFDRSNYETIRAEWSGPQRSSPRHAEAVDSSATVGDTVEVRVVTGEGSCNSYDSITTVVREMGVNGIWLEDIDNPDGGYEASDFEQLSETFDDLIYPADTTQFGAPSDADSNGRIVIVVSKEVNEYGSLGFTTTCDFAARSGSNLGSNEGEYFYGEAPDPNGDHGDAVSVAEARTWLPAIVAHELVHVIQLSGRLAVGGSIPSIWIAEGQATMGEEIAGHAVEGRTTGQNLGIEVVLNWDDTTSFDWYSDGIVDMALYFGWAPTQTDNTIHLDEAPHECTWLGNNNGGPCFEGREAYGVPWSLLRWISDQYGSNYPGGEAGFQRDIVRSTTNGFAMLEQLTGVEIETLLAQWAATLYVDDRLGGANPTLEITSWDLFDIFYGTYTLPGGDFGLVPALRLAPQEEQFASFSRNADVRAGSTYYTLISGSGRLGTAIWVGEDADTPLPSNMQVWIVRMQ